jgi:hypothetical protein
VGGRTEVAGGFYEGPIVYSAEEDSAGIGDNALSDSNYSLDDSLKLTQDKSLDDSANIRRVMTVSADDRGRESSHARQG